MQCQPPLQQVCQQGFFADKCSDFWAMVTAGAPLQDNDVVCCDGPCNSAYHVRCQRPHVTQEELDAVGEGRWLCRACSAKVGWAYAGSLAVM